jgi:hypothetical protein
MSTRHRHELKSKEPYIARTCQYADCENAALTAHLFCERHAVTPEGVSYYREIQAAAAALLDSEYTDSAENETVLRRENAALFTQRLKQGKFNKLLDAAVSKILDQAAATKSYDLEVGALRYAMTRTIAEETDVHRLSLAIARLANAMARLAIAEYGTRDPKPVIRYGQEWNPPLAGGEPLVHYIWRHRPEDFAERYMARIDDRESLQPGRVNTDAEGKYLPPPLPEWRRHEADARRSDAGGADGEGIDPPEGAWLELYEPAETASEG